MKVSSEGTDFSTRNSTDHEMAFPVNLPDGLRTQFADACYYRLMFLLISAMIYLINSLIQSEKDGYHDSFS